MTIKSSNAVSYATISPSTGTVVREFPVASESDVESALEASSLAFSKWSQVTLKQRTESLRAISRAFQDRKDELAELIGLEMGKVFSESQGEIDIVSSIFDYYADNSAEFLSDESLSVTGGGSALVRKEPIGSLLGIMPWNYPYYQVARFAAPNLALGNTIILKHAPNCPQTAVAIEGLFREAGIPKDVFINIFATNDQVAQIISDPRNSGVSLTGSERAGSAVAETAGRNLKKCVLELGGSDPFIVLDSPDITGVAKSAAAGRLENRGQSCISPKRFIVVNELYDSFVEAMVDEFKSVSIGHADETDTQFGPMSSAVATELVLEQVQDAVDKGASILVGGSSLDRKGFFFEPTVLTNVTPEMRAFREEIFGPVAVIYSVDNVDEAVELANETPYGLGSAVWTQDESVAKLVVERLEAGMVWVNGVTWAKAELPFGGTKRSGIGRELGKYGIEEFMNRKMVRWEAS